MLTCSARSISSLRVTVVTSSGGILISLISTFLVATSYCWQDGAVLPSDCSTEHRAATVAANNSASVLPYPSGILLLTGPKHTHVCY